MGGEQNSNERKIIDADVVILTTGETEYVIDVPTQDRKQQLIEQFENDPLYVYLQGEGIITPDILELKGHTIFTTKQVVEMLQIPRLFDGVKGEFYVKDATIRYWLMVDTGLRNYIQPDRHGQKWAFPIASFLRLKMIAILFYKENKDIKEIQAISMGLVDKDVIINSDNILAVLEEGHLNRTTNLAVVRNALRAYMEWSQQTMTEQQRRLDELERNHEEFEKIIKDLKNQQSGSDIQELIQKIEEEKQVTESHTKSISEIMELVEKREQATISDDQIEQAVRKATEGQTLVLQQKLNELQKRLDLRKMAIEQWEELGLFTKLRTNKEKYIEEYIEKHMKIVFENNG